MVADWFQNGTTEGGMAVNLSIKNVADEVAERLRERARRNHRSLQAELLALLEETTMGRRRSVAEVLAAVRAEHLRTPAEAIAMLREDRDGR
jgi:plasmid stability protein